MKFSILPWLVDVGRNSSLVVCWACCLAWCSVVGSILLWGEFFRYTLYPQNSYRYGWENKLRSSVHTCIQLHGLKRSWHSCPRWVNAGNKNTPGIQHPQRRSVTTSMVGLINGHIHRNLTQNGESQRQEKKLMFILNYFGQVLFKERTLLTWFYEIYIKHL